ncbi:hypothetical protein VQ056_00635 [Paenibacillus sp. JTLBN-2024]
MKSAKKSPYKFRKQVLEQLIKIYLAWEKKLIELKKPYYLKIWVGIPNLWIRRSWRPSVRKSLIMSSF